jgi:hypothetical protein
VTLMPRAPTPEQLADYAHMRGFTLALPGVVDELILATPTSRVGQVLPDGTQVEHDAPNEDLLYSPGLADSLAAEERRSIPQARAQVRMLLQDLLEVTRDLAPDFVRSVDERFAAAGLPTLSEIRREVWKTIPKVLARGRIRSEEEYYLLVERLNDVSGGDGLSPEDRERVGRMVAEFEERKARPGRRKS